MAQTNQEVVDAATWIFVAVLPSQAAETLGALKFEARHRVVSLMAGVALGDVASFLGHHVPESSVVQAIPLPPVAHQQGVTVVHPAAPQVVAWFNLLGTCVPVATAAQMKVVPTVTCLMGTYYAFLQTAHRWLVAKGVDSAAASTYVGALLHSIAADGKGVGGAGFEALIAEQTPGGYNEQVAVQGPVAQPSPAL